MSSKHTHTIPCRFSCAPLIFRSWSGGWWAHVLSHLYLDSSQGVEEGEEKSATNGKAVGLPVVAKKDEEDIIKAELRKTIEENGGDQLNVAPRKPDWDLKRDVSKKLDKLNKMTQKAIVEILKEKMAAQEQEDGDEEEDDE
jgi:hypothetical protein